MVAKFVGLCGGVVVVLFAFDFDGGYGITDCGWKWGGGVQKDKIYPQIW